MPPCRQHDPPDDNLTCCARRVLSDCPDFQEDCCWLEETLKARNHKLIFFPKFHCELNFIEMIWGYAKARLRAGCEFNFKWLEAQLPTVLDSIPLSFFRSTSRHCFRYMDSYRYDLTPAARLYAMKKFRGHRMIPRESLALVVKEFDDIQSKKIRAHVTLWLDLSIFNVPYQLIKSKTTLSPTDFFSEKMARFRFKSSPTVYETNFKKNYDFDDLWKWNSYQ